MGFSLVRVTWRSFAKVAEVILYGSGGHQYRRDFPEVDSWDSARSVAKGVVEEMGLEFNDIEGFYDNKGEIVALYTTH